MGYPKKIHMNQNIMKSSTIVLKKLKIDIKKDWYWKKKFSTAWLEINSSKLACDKG